MEGLLEWRDGAVDAFGRMHVSIPAGEDRDEDRFCRVDG